MMCSLFLSVSAVLTMAKEPITRLVIWSKDGTKVVYALAEKPKMTFVENELVVKTNNIEVNYNLDNMSRFTYDSGDITGITNLKTERPFSIQGEALIFPTLSANSTISIYSLNGSIVFKKKVRNIGEYAFPLSSIAAGIYMVNVNGLTYKIVKR